LNEVDGHSNGSQGLGPRRAAHPSPISPPEGSADAKDHEIQRLGEGLALSTDAMHTLISKHATALDELQLAAAQALSGNHELQRLNAELQDAKRGIVSINEALARLNRDLQSQNLQLTRFNDDIQRGLDNANVLVDAVAQPLVILDGDLRIEKANLAFHDTFATTAEWTRGRSLSEVGGGHWSTPDLLEALRAVLDSGEAVEELAIETEFPRIGFRNLFLKAKRLQPAGGAGARLLLAIEDRTEMTRSERGHAAVLALEHEARERAEAADHVKDQFVATVSHELRGPLNVISGWVNILLGAGENPDSVILNKALTAIGRGVAAQTRLVSDLLEHSRIAAGKVELQRAAIDLVTVAEAALVGVRAAADAKDIDIELSGDRASSVILGDWDRMQQVLWNLFFNAVKFTPTGGSVRVSIGRIDNQVHVTVRDDGNGIPAEFLPHVFDRFRQAEGSSNRNHGGLGLGLTLVRELVELHGGTVQAASAGEGLGATFTVILPIPTLLLPASESERPPPESERRPSSLAPAPFLQLPLDMLQGARLLVVDDEADARDALVSLLERYGAVVRTAASVPEAMAAVTLELPDVLISDLGMSGEDGYELIRRVRLLAPEAGGQLPALAVSAYATELHRKKMMRSGFQTYLEKPVAPAELVTEVARLAVR
jgi:two-component system, chemotaxis family, CheB/CheR fusion protein